MKKFLTYCFLFALPFMVITLPYWLGDPFKVLRHYDLYYSPGELRYINISRTMESQKMFEQYKDIYGWNSYIFGSSRSGRYRVKDWLTHLDSVAKPAHMNGYGESIYGIWRKMQYMDGKTEMRNVLICLDYLTLNQAELEKTPLYCLTPNWDPSLSRLEYQWIYLKTYLRPNFLLAYCDYFMLGKVKPYMIQWGVMQEGEKYELELQYNEEWFDFSLESISDSLYYTRERMETFPSRTIEQSYEQKSCVGEKQLMMLREIRDICERNGADYRVVINPTYDQRKLLPNDMKCLRELFGERLYDFSGQNKWSEDYHNFSDGSHFKPRVAAELMNIIYEK